MADIIRCILFLCNLSVVWISQLSIWLLYLYAYLFENYLIAILLISIWVSICVSAQMYNLFV